MNKRKALSSLLVLAAIPLTVFSGAMLLEARRYVLVCLAVTVLCIAAFFIRAEADGKMTGVRILLVAVMTAISIAGRFAFSYIPFFKPVTAFVIITGVYLGAQSGFLCGALSALISNFIFGQGAWTPFQMLAWGMIGFAAGIFAKSLVKSKLWLYCFGVLSGIFYSLFLDTWSSIYVDGTIVLSRYLTLISAALPITVIYAVSNVIFLILLFKPIGRRIERITVKYGLVQ